MRVYPTEPSSYQDRSSAASAILHYRLPTPVTMSEIRELSGDDNFIISEIECINGLTHLKDILDLSDAVAD